MGMDRCNRREIEAPLRSRDREEMERIFDSGGRDRHSIDEIVLMVFLTPCRDDPYIQFLSFVCSLSQFDLLRLYGF